MHVVVVTCSHRGDDARIVHRQARVLLASGHRVTLVAPDPGVEARRFDPPGLVRRDVPRATGRDRVNSWQAVRRTVSSVRHSADLMIVHDPELIPLLALGRRWCPMVWDVHEDFVAMARDTVWMPLQLRGALAGVVRVVEVVARRRCHIVLAEDGYAKRFPGSPVVPNTTWVDESVAPLDGSPRAVYVGRVSFDRGVRELVAVGEALRSRGGPTLVVVGSADAECHDFIADAHRRGALEWRGALSNPEALAVVKGATVGLSLLHDRPNYVVSRPTKVIEYLACGTPVVTTPLPLAAELVRSTGSGVVTSSWSGSVLVDEVVSAVMEYAGSPDRRESEGHIGWSHVRDHWSWNTDGPRFVSLVERLATTSR